MRTIKRYSNRKLYDTQEKKYVTLDQIAILIKEGEDIRVLDNDSGDDLTNVTLSQILVEQEKKKEGVLPRSFLTDIIKQSTNALDNVRRTVGGWFGQPLPSEKDVDETIQTAVKKGEMTLEDAKKLKEEFLKRTRQYREKLDQLVEERVHDILSRLSIPHKSDIDRLAERLDELTRKYEGFLEAQRQAKEAAAAAAPAPAPAAPAAPAPPLQASAPKAQP